MKYQIDAEMCGDEATDDIARRVVEILNSKGYDCEFSECADNKGNEDAVPDNTFFDAVGQASNEVVDERYEVYLVPNGRKSGFRQGMLGTGYPDACHGWGTYETLEEVRAAYAKWAAENWDYMNSEEEFENDEAREKARDAAIKLDVRSLSIEWKGDLKWVMTRKVRELRDGSVDFVEALG